MGAPQPKFVNPKKKGTRLPAKPLDHRLLTESCLEGSKGGSKFMTMWGNLFATTAATSI